MAVDEHAAAVASRAGGIDVSFNAISHGAFHGTPLVDMSYEDFAGPILTALRTHFLTGRAAARHMIERRSGVIMSITATTARHVIPQVGGTGVMFDVIESLSRLWARELGPQGIRVLWLRTTGIPEALADVPRFPDYGIRSGQGLTREELIAWLAGKTMLGRLTTLEDVGTVAAFVASDRAKAMTGNAVTIEGGSVGG
jgi:NAD(P)-dependent dehydrogenase (short-subunit alcohol dehydrogenase family)